MDFLTGNIKRIYFRYLSAAFLRNDKSPGLATMGVLAGGLFNMFGDYFFVFTCDMGICGAGLATAIDSGIFFVVMPTHFFSRKNTLRLVKVEQGLWKFREISVTGFSTFFIDVAMGILTVLFNRQIMKYLGTDALAVYGPIIQVNTFVQCCAYSGGTGGAASHLHQFRSGEGGPDSIWLAMPITELVILLYALTTMKRMTKALAQ